MRGAASTLCLFVALGASPAASGQAAEPTLEELLAEKLAEAQRERAAAPVLARAAASGRDESPLASALELALSGGVMALLIFGAAWGVKRHRAKPGEAGESKALELVESLWVGRGQRVLLVSVGGQRVLVGSSGGAIQSFAVLDPPAPLGAPAARAEAPRPEPQGPRSAARLPIDDGHEPAAGRAGSRTPAREPAAPALEFAELVEDELAETFKPSREQRRRILNQLSRL